MGCSRETRDLFFYIKRKHWSRSWRLIKTFDRIAYEDTFMPLFCKIKGHKPYQTDKQYEPDSWACSRCNRYIDINPRKEKLKKLKKLK